MRNVSLPKYTLFAGLLIVTAVIMHNPSHTNASGDNPPRVTTSLPSDITELPRTGVSLAVWAAAAIIPMGARLLKKNKSDEQSENHSPNSIWTSRQLKK